MTLNITSMMDMFTIILVFLLKSFSTSAANIQVSNNLSLPKSNSEKPPVELVTVVVDKKNIVIDGKVVLNHNQGVLDLQYLDETGFKILPVTDVLVKHAEKAKFIAEKNKKFEFEGKVLLQMDKDLPFTMLRQIMYSAGQAEYSEFKFVAIKK